MCNVYISTIHIQINFLPVLSGMSQRSILELMLFIICINDMPLTHDVRINCVELFRLLMIHNRVRVFHILLILHCYLHNLES